jgi:hypothetical protein
MRTFNNWNTYTKSEDEILNALKKEKRPESSERNLKCLKQRLLRFWAFTFTTTKPIITKKLLAKVLDPSQVCQRHRHLVYLDGHQYSPTNAKPSRQLVSVASRVVVAESEGGYCIPSLFRYATISWWETKLRTRASALCSASRLLCLDFEMQKTTYQIGSQALLRWG